MVARLVRPPVTWMILTPGRPMRSPSTGTRHWRGCWRFMMTTAMKAALRHHLPVKSAPVSRAVPRRVPAVSRYPARQAAARLLAVQAAALWLPAHPVAWLRLLAVPVCRPVNNVTGTAPCIRCASRPRAVGDGNRIAAVSRAAPVARNRRLGAS